ncbi:MAG: hypothetical protein LWY06_03280, partial [Firmicutes bacterium]|nr:hypothetical protein [Bacillota bacterium]
MKDKQNKKLLQTILFVLVLLITGVLLFIFLPDYLSPEESHQKILLLEYNDAAHKEMLSFYGFHSRNGKADIQKQSGPVKANVCNMDDRYMYYLEPGGTLVSVTYSERKELGFSGFDNGVKNIVFSDPHKGITKILEIKHPLLSAHSGLTKQPMSVPFWQVYAGPYKDDLLIFSGKLSTYADNSDRALYTNFREIYESDFTPYNNYDSLITDNSFNPFNLSDNGVSFMCSSIS